MKRLVVAAPRRGEERNLGHASGRCLVCVPCRDECWNLQLRHCVQSPQPNVFECVRYVSWQYEQMCAGERLKGSSNWCGCQEQSCPHPPGTGVKRLLVVIPGTAHRASLSMTRSSQSLWRTVRESTN